MSSVEFGEFKNIKSNTYSLDTNNLNNLNKYFTNDNNSMLNYEEIVYDNDNIEPNYKILKYEFYDDKVQYNNE